MAHATHLRVGIALCLLNFAIATFLGVLFPSTAKAAPSCARAVVATSADLTGQLDREARRRLALYQNGRIDNLEASLGEVWSGTSDRFWTTRSGEKLRARIDRACGDGEMVTPGQLSLASSQSIGRIFDSFFGRPYALATRGEDPALASCQAKLVRATARCQARQARAFMHCQKGSDSAEDLEACLENPVRSCPMADTLARACEAVASGRSASPIAAVAPACGANDLAGMAVCAEKVGKCLACERMNQSMGLSADCDMADDGLANASCAGNAGCSQNPLKDSSGAYLVPTVADGGVLQLDCPVPPNTSPVSNKYPDFNMAYFAWNSFVALNWPSAAQDQSDGSKEPRGIPNLMGNFQNVANDELVVWETYKEKREVFYQGTCEYPGYPGGKHENTVVPCSSSTACPSPLADNSPPNQIVNHCLFYTPAYDTACNGAPLPGVMGECLHVKTDPNDKSPEGFTGRSCDPARDRPDGTNSDCGSDECVTLFGCLEDSDCEGLTTAGTCDRPRQQLATSSGSVDPWEPLNRNPLANTWSGEQYSPLPTVEACPSGLLEVGATELGDDQRARARNRPMLNTNKFTFNSLDETIQVQSEALEDFEALCAGTFVFRCEDGPNKDSVCQIYADGTDSCGPNVACLKTTEEVSASMCEDRDPEGAISRVCVNSTNRACINDSDCGGVNQFGACQYLQLGQLPDRPACCSLRGNLSEPRVFKGNPADYDPHSSRPGDPGTTLYYEVKVNYDYFDYVAGNNFYQSAFSGPAASIQNFRLPFRTSGAQSGSSSNPQNYQVAQYNAATCLANGGKQRVCEAPGNPRVCSNDNSISCTVSADCGNAAGTAGALGSTCDPTIPSIPCESDADCSFLAGGQCPASPAVEEPCRTGAFQLKAAWVLLEDYTNGVKKTAADYPTYFTTIGSFFESGTDDGLCQAPGLFGLVGLHIIQRTHQSYPQQPRNPIGGAFIFASWERTESTTSLCASGPNSGEVCGDSADGTDVCGEGHECKSDFFYSNLGINRSQFFPGIDDPDGPINVGRMNTRPKVCSVAQHISCLWDSDCPPGNSCDPIPAASQTLAGGVLPSAGTQSVNEQVHSAIGCSGPGPKPIWCNYQLVGVQYQPVASDHPSVLGDTDSMEGSPEQDYYLANLLIETNADLQKFRGLPPQNTPIIGFQDATYPVPASGRKSVCENLPTLACTEDADCTDLIDQKLVPGYCGFSNSDQVAAGERSPMVVCEQDSDCPATEYKCADGPKVGELCQFQPAGANSCGYSGSDSNPVYYSCLPSGDPIVRVTTCQDKDPGTGQGMCRYRQCMVDAECSVCTDGAAEKIGLACDSGQNQPAGPDGVNPQCSSPGESDGRCGNVPGDCQRQCAVSNSNVAHPVTYDMGWVVNPDAPVPYNRSVPNVRYQGESHNMGGCMGCHGVAQINGYAFSFVALIGQGGTEPDTMSDPGPSDVTSARRRLEELSPER